MEVYNFTKEELEETLDQAKALLLRHMCDMELLEYEGRGLCCNTYYYIEK